MMALDYECLLIFPPALTASLSAQSDSRACRRHRDGSRCSHPLLYFSTAQVLIRFPWMTTFAVVGYYAAEERLRAWRDDHMGYPCTAPSQIAGRTVGIRAGRLGAVPCGEGKTNAVLELPRVTRVAGCCQTHGTSEVQITWRLTKAGLMAESRIWSICVFQTVVGRA
ncbi:hypothetical protein B0J12DRAFT_310096 [Macrophomina phaseolina]|uniref:Uncharacterized protein n=1 Tax=Macrophomina phaseolina TaxID=35725 RepID=A0ABQ8FWQ8_9PEZI|nr:hypothetical protein B0J12DRAFT_310096 [Macrophomina phaseolina]